MHNEEVELLESAANVVRIRIDDAHLLADHIHGFELAGMNRLHHLVVIETFGGRKRHIPCLFKPGANFGIVNRLVSGEIIRHRTVVARPLHVIMTAHGISPGSRPHIVSRDEKKVRNCRRSIRTLVVLGDAHCPENADTLGLGNHVRHGLKGLFRQAGDTRSSGHSEGFQTFSIGV